MNWLLLLCLLLAPVSSAGQAPPADRIPAYHLISGKVVSEGGRPLPILLPKLYVLVENGMNQATFGEGGVRIRGSGTFGAIPVLKDGNFTLSLRDGEYPISLITGLGEPLSANEGYYVKSISFGSADLLKEKLRVKGSTKSTITITLAAGQKPSQ